MNEHAEGAQLKAAAPREVTLYTRPGCHLCEKAKLVMTPILQEFGATLREVNIESDPTLAERYGQDIPVVFLGSRKVAKHQVDAEQFRRQLEQP